MISVCGFSGFSVALFHLFNHAFFKALLFLGAGMIIHALNNEQDMRKMGSLVLLLPITYCSMLVASCSLSGFPFLSGFFSKDLILEISYNSFLFNGLFVF
jgi:NADH-ubiquinone oxidoreductase chain 5